MNISIVVPVYNSFNIIPKLVGEIFSQISSELKFEIILVNDHSPDNSWNVIKDLSRKYSKIIGINLRKNCGQHSAIMAGLRESSGDVIVMMDDDLQHSPKYIPDLYSTIIDGADVCYSRFKNIKHKSWKIIGSRFNGFIANLLINKPKDLYLSPFKAISRDICDLIIQYDGPYPYVDGLILSYTDNISVIEVEHQQRLIGSSNYSFRKSISLWVMMATGFSVKPLRLATYMGFFVSFIAFLFVVFLVVFKLIYDINIQGWTSLATIGLFMGGVQLVAIGIIGEYLGRSYLKLNGKPQAIVKEKTRGKNA